MSVAPLKINGADVCLGCVWAHLKGPGRINSRPYRLTVPFDQVKAVFGVTANAPLEFSILEDVQKYGSVLLDHYLATLCKLNNVHREPIAWVIISVDSVNKTDAGISLEGFAEEFRRGDVPVLKSLK